MTTLESTTNTARGRAGQGAILAHRDALHRYALWLARRCRNLVSEEDLLAAADLAMVQARRRFRPERGDDYYGFARTWVRGAVHRLVDQEHRIGILKRRAADGEIPTWLPYARPEPDTGCLAGELLARLTLDEAWVLLCHDVGATTLADVARSRCRHRAWATRTRQQALARLRAAA